MRKHIQSMKRLKSIPLLKRKVNSAGVILIRILKDPTINAAADAGKPSKYFPVGPFMNRISRYMPQKR